MAYKEKRGENSWKLVVDVGEKQTDRETVDLEQYVLKTKRF